MLSIFFSILPVFLVIGAGMAAKRLGWLPPVFVKYAARVALNLAIPALLFRTVYKVPASLAFPWTCLLSVLAAMACVWGLAALYTRVGLPASKSSPFRATFTQGTIHCNVGFLGLATVYYSQGDAGLAIASLLTPAIFTFQTMLAALTLAHGSQKDTKLSAIFGRMLINPIIVAPLAGLAANGVGLNIPDFLDRTLELMAGLGLPLALLIIGATLDLKAVAGNFRELAVLCLAKLAFLPLLALPMLMLLHLEPLTVTVAILLLSQPVAAIAVIMAGDLGGDIEFAAGSVSLTTALSPFTLTAWLMIATLLA